MHPHTLIKPNRLDVLLFQSLDPHMGLEGQ